jgi:hypothetical protein
MLILYPATLPKVFIRSKSFLGQVFRGFFFVVVVVVCLFLWDWDLNWGLCLCKAGTLLLRLHLQPVFRVFKYKIVWFANRNNFTSFLSVPFISFSCLLFLLGIQVLYWIKLVEWHPCFVLDFRGNSFRFFMFRIMLSTHLSYVPFIVFRYFLLFLASSEFLSWKNVEFCQRLFLHVLRWLCGFSLGFYLLIFICWNFLAFLEWNQLLYDMW